MSEDNEVLGKELRKAQEKADRLQHEEIDEKEALDILEEAVGDVERLGEQLEKGEQ